jgi:hypothetical protein
MLGCQKMNTDSSEDVGPPMPGRDEQQDAKQNCLWRKKERHFAVGETKRPGNLRREVIADGAGQDVSHRAEQCPGGALLGSGIYRNRELAVKRVFTRSIDELRTVFPLCHASLHCGSPRL